MTNSSTEPALDYRSVVHSLRLPSTILFAPFSPVVVTGNALVCVAIWRNTSLRTLSYILLAGLAFTDFCSGLIVQPILVANGLIYLIVPQMNLFHEKGWLTALSITKNVGNGYSSYFYQATMLIVTFMSIERWLHMSRRSLVTARRAWFTIAVLLLIPIPLTVNYVQEPSRVFFSVASISILFFSFILTSIAYLKVLRIIRCHQQQIHANELSQSLTQPAIDFQKYKKSVYTVLYILAIVYITYLPTTISLGLVLVLKVNGFMLLFATVSAILLYLSSLVNPLLYFWRMKDIQNEVRQLVKKMFCRDN